MNRDLPEADVVFIEIGHRDKLDMVEATSAAKAFIGARAHYPEAPILISIGGYDEEARDLWEFPEACRYVQLWARLAHLSTPEAAALHAIPVTAREAIDDKLAGEMTRYRFEFAGLLGACGCWDTLLTTRGKAGKSR